MTMWDFFHAHADGLGAMFGFTIFLLFLMWFIREMNR
jgi:hypothetical protein